MSGKGGEGGKQANDTPSGGGDRDYGDSAGYGGGGAALDYDEVLGDTGRGRRVENNPLDEVIPDPGGASGDAIRDRAYSKWEQAGRPDGREDEFWSEAESEIRGEGADRGSE